MKKIAVVVVVVALVAAVVSEYVLAVEQQALDFATMKKYAEQGDAESQFALGRRLDIPLTQKVEKLTLRNVRQYYVTNKKIGPISVIEGKVVNGFSAPKELLEVEAALYRQDKSPLVSKRQFAGTSLSLLQLQTLGEKELEAFINNKQDVLANNTNIPTDGEVPFMVLFYNPPPTIKEFGVKIVGVRDKDEDEAAQWYQKAAEQGHAEAQASLGLMYVLGRDVPKDEAKAVQWFQKAAKQGNANGQAALGWMYMEGRGVIRDKDKGCALLRDSAEQGHGEAINLYNEYCNVTPPPQPLHRKN